MPRHFLSLADYTGDELLALLARAAELKSMQARREGPQTLAGRTVALLFEKASTRTRVSFEVGVFQLGGHAVVMQGGNSQLGRGEPVADTARVLGRYVDGLMVRTFGHDRLVELAEHAGIPVINGLTDLLHPCQILADLQTCAEAFGAAAVPSLKVAWIGDGNNMAHSWINAAGRIGFELALACPEGYDPEPAILAAAPHVRLLRSPAEAVAGANVVTTDVWASMGQEEEAKARQVAFADFQVDEALMARAAPEAIFLHCLPAHRGEEVSAGVIDGPQSRVWDEAENRLHAQKAILELLLR